MLKDVGLIKLADASVNDLDANRAAIFAGSKVNLKQINVATWFLPIVSHALKGGVRTVFMFAERMSKKWGTLNIFVVYAHNGCDFDIELINKSLAQHFPSLRFIVRKFVHGKDSVSQIPLADIAFCTLWTTAYLLLKYNQVSKKFYFMQDYEPLFYEAGSVYAVIEQTYRFGFRCIANTPGVGNKYLAYSKNMRFFYPGVDSEIFCPRKKDELNKISRIVFYGRPGNPRNCFSLGVMILKALKQKMLDKVEIISVGAAWNVSDYGLDGIVTNLGLLGSLESVAELYRSVDIGLVFMVTPHPSYQPLEYMASGCVVVTNVNESNSWFLNEDNSLLIEPIPEIAAQRIYDLLGDAERMLKYRQEGYSTVSEYTWDGAYNAFEKCLIEDSKYETQ